MSVPEENKELLTKVLEEIDFVKNNMGDQIIKKLALREKEVNIQKQNQKEIRDFLESVRAELENKIKGIQCITDSLQIQIDQIKVDIVKVIQNMNDETPERIKTELIDIIVRYKGIEEKLKW